MGKIGDADIVSHTELGLWINVRVEMPLTDVLGVKMNVPVLVMEEGQATEGQVLQVS